MRHNSVRVPHVRPSVRGTKTVFFDCFPLPQPQWLGLRPIDFGPRTLGRTWGTRTESWRMGVARVHVQSYAENGIRGELCYASHKLVAMMLRMATGIRNFQPKPISWS